MGNILLTLVVTITSTFVVGSLVGYIIHWLLHTRLVKYKLFKPLAKSHNVHHQYYTIHNFESDTYRDPGKDSSTFFFAPVITLAVGLLGLGLWFVFQVWWIYLVILIEGIAIGLLNTKIHDYFHIRNHWLNKYSMFRRLKKLHWWHHKRPKINHGIIWFVPDKLFGTFYEKK